MNDININVFTNFDRVVLLQLFDGGLGRLLEQEVRGP